MIKNKQITNSSETEEPLSNFTSFTTKINFNVFLVFNLLIFLPVAQF